MAIRARGSPLLRNALALLVVVVAVELRLRASHASFGGAANAAVWPAASSFVPSRPSPPADRGTPLFFPSDPRPRRRRLLRPRTGVRCGSSGLPPAGARLRSLPLRAAAAAAASSSVEEQPAVGAGDAASSRDDDECSARTCEPDEDELALLERTERVPPGRLTRDHERDMRAAMRRLSSAGRRRDDVDARRRRRDAALVERFLDRLAKERQHASGAESENNDGRTARDPNADARTYNLAIEAWAHADVRGAAERAERVLKRLRVASSVDRGGKNRDAPPAGASPRPDLFSFAHCYAAWYRESVFAERNVGNAKASSVAMRKAESVLRSMEDALMNDPPRSSNVVEDVNSLLVMWSNANVNMPGLSDRFLRFVEVASEGTKNGTWLNTRSYNLVINGECPNIILHVILVAVVGWSHTKFSSKHGQRAGIMNPSHGPKHW